MKLHELTQWIHQIPNFEILTQTLQKTNQEIILTGLSGSAKSFVLSSFYHLYPNALFVITGDDETAYSFASDLKSFSGQDVLHYPGKEILPYEDMEPLVELTAERIYVLQQLHEYSLHPTQNPPIVVISIRELTEKTFPLSLFDAMTITLEFGNDYSMDELTLKLAKGGYERVPLVEQRGQFAVRGGILDVFNITSSDPVRMEFFGNTLESIRTFRVSNQRSKEEIEKIVIYPASESELIGYSLSQNLPLVSLADYLPKQSFIVLDEALLIQEKQAEQINLFEERYQGLGKDKKENIQPSQLTLSLDNFIKESGSRNIIQFSLLQNPTPIKSNPDNIFQKDIPTRTVESYKGQFDRLIENIKTWQSEGYLVLLGCDNSGQKDRFSELLHEKEVFPEEFVHLQSGQQTYPISLEITDLSAGFISSDLKLAILTDREIFTRYSRVRHFRRFREGVPISDVMELSPGDVIVHIDYGIGRFQGLKQMDIDGTVGDFLILEYADTNRLYVPVTQIHMIQKYVAGEEAHPKLNTLGDKSWQKSKTKAKESIQKMAKELLELYGARQMVQGVSYPADTIWQKEFETSFLYEETPDQLKAIEDVKSDMESTRPMDRLLCGDVGFGKTEVAIRAAFKAVMNKKQVAILVPTTLLAEQHWYTFSERLAEYPISVEMLSRFRSPQDIKRTLEGVTAGSVDIVIGTHRILSKDLKFKNLGLLIVDEEQRFGVAHKERLKQIKKEVDVLTLSATPIPRTLYMSLTGIRDMSLINTPPEDRLPIQTFVHRFEPKVIKEAILREMNRNGQVFFIHNRVQSIYRMADKVQEIVPQARVAVAHGQMQEKELEKIMLDFISRRYDVLLSTTIVENGIDIPNCNTIIIDRADALGLSQLYQLRGRVGRDRHQAYAYLLVPATTGLTSIATRRLRALQEFTDLGSGYRIAMRDLEIRGMGNLLGKDQSGHMEAIGFDLYCKMVEEAISEMKGDVIYENPETRIEVPVKTLIPSEYIPDEKQKFTIYRKLATTKDIVDIEQIESELIDRFGALPEETSNLIRLVRVRVQAAQMNIIHIKIASDRVSFTWTDKVPHKAIKALSSLKGVELRQTAADQLILIRTQPAKKDPVSQLETLLRKLKDD